jgi:periplasmic divalent cation tolerance protein
MEPLAQAEIALVYVTVPSQEVGLELGRELVLERWVACANLLGPVTSVYEWEGKLEEATEWTLLLKTRPESVSAVIDEVARRHPYQCPAIFALSSHGCLPRFADWVSTQTVRI